MGTSETTEIYIAKHEIKYRSFDTGNYVIPVNFLCEIKEMNPKMEPSYLPPKVGNCPGSSMEGAGTLLIPSLLPNPLAPRPRPLPRLRLPES